MTSLIAGRRNVASATATGRDRAKSQ
jgi:hypothetical protein